MFLNDFLNDLLLTNSPSGNEIEVQNIIKKYIQPYSHEFNVDIMGNCIASILPKNNDSSSLKIMLSGHMDEIGFMVKYIDDIGYIYIDPIGGHDINLISGRNVIILNHENGYINGVIGKKAIHLMSFHERKNPSLDISEYWIDIGVKTKKEAENLVSIGDYVVYNQVPCLLKNNNFTGKALDNKLGVYVTMECLKQLSQKNINHTKSIFAVGSVQEEIGLRGVIPITYKINPDIAIAIDVTHATDFPKCNKEKHGNIKLGHGPVISVGPNTDYILTKKIINYAKQHNLLHQIEANSFPLSNDAQEMQISRTGKKVLSISIPIRYMHTPSEVANFDDINNTVKLIKNFILNL